MGLVLSMRFFSFFVLRGRSWHNELNVVKLWGRMRGFDLSFPPNILKTGIKPLGPVRLASKQIGRSQGTASENCTHSDFYVYSWYPLEHHV